MGRGTTRMYAPAEPGKKRVLIGNRPKVSIWCHKGQWYFLKGCCWTGWIRQPVDTATALARLEACRAFIVKHDGTFGYGDYWPVLRRCIEKCTPRGVALWAAKLGVQP